MLKIHFLDESKFMIEHFFDYIHVYFIFKRKLPMWKLKEPKVEGFLQNRKTLLRQSDPPLIKVQWVLQHSRLSKLWVLVPPIFGNFGFIHFQREKNKCQKNTGSSIYICPLVIYLKFLSPFQKNFETNDTSIESTNKELLDL